MKLHILFFVKMQHRALSIILTLFLSLQTVPAGEKAALVIGNNGYTYATPLLNPRNDAEAIANALEQRGYQVTRILDGNAVETLNSVNRFAVDHKDAESIFFFFAGHGIEVEEENYLLPVDVKLEDQSALLVETVPLKMILEKLGDTGRLRMFVLDCCRNNPFTGSRSRSWMRIRGKGGLAEVSQTQLADGTMLVFSGEPGKTVPDGAGDHSPFAEALLTQLSTLEEKPVLDVFSGVSQVIESSQKPWVRFDGSGQSLMAFKKHTFVPSQRALQVARQPPSQTKAATKHSPSSDPRQATKEVPFVNSLGMKFVPVPNTNLLYSVWETRVADYAAYAEQVPVVDDSWRTHGETQEPNHPVRYLTWMSATDFCEWLSQEEGLVYRLPTDHEWSIASTIGNLEDPSASPWLKTGVPMNGSGWGCQYESWCDYIEKTYGGIRDVYPWGNVFDQNAPANLSGDSDGFSSVAPVGSFAPNRFGLHDLGGNVAEYCKDWYGEGGFKFTRGGSFKTSLERNARASTRQPAPLPRTERLDLGFRCVLELGPSPWPAPLTWEAMQELINVEETYFREPEHTWPVATPAPLLPILLFVGIFLISVMAIVLRSKASKT